MPTPIHVSELDAKGYIGDLLDPNFTPNAFMEARNVRFIDGKVLRPKGRRAVTPLPVTPYHSLFIANTPSYWLIAGLDKVYSWNGSSLTDVSRVSGYSTSEDFLWSSDIFGGIAILNNGVDVPQCQLGGTYSSLLANFPNWPSGYTAKIVKGYKNYLIAYNITHPGGAFPHMIKWSAPAVPGAMPPNWDATDPASDANEIELYDSWAGPIVDALPLKDKNIVYKANSIWTMQTIPSAFVFDIQQSIQGVGLLSRNCVKSIANGNAHLFASDSDLMIYDGATVRSVIAKKARSRYLEIRTSQYIRNSFMVANPRYKEVLFCYPTNGNKWPTEAMVLNEETGAISIRDLKATPHMALGDWLSAAKTWDSATETWDQKQEIWTADMPFSSGQDLHSVSLDNYFYQEDVLNPAASEPAKLVLVLALERTVQGTTAVEVSYFKTFLRARINLRGGPIYCRVGTKNDPNEQVVWGEKKVYNPDVYEWFDAIVTGRIVFLELTSIQDKHFELGSYEVMLKRKGRF